MRGLIVLHRTLLLNLERWRSCEWYAFSLPSPDQNSATLIHRNALGINQLFLEHIQILVIQIEAHLQCTIRHPSLAFEEREDLGENFIEGHGVTLHYLGFSSLLPPKMTQIIEEE